MRFHPLVVTPQPSDLMRIWHGGTAVLISSNLGQILNMFF
jgi:hypothetical protein